jgi:hypothetical protein
MIKEDLLYYLWKFRKFNAEKLTTTDGQDVIIEKTGEQNFDSGPDFCNAKIIIDGTQWYGNVEMHVFSSDWEKHGHQHDPAYNNVILHVIYDHDQSIVTQSGINIPCIELKRRIDKTDIKNYKLLRFNKNWIPCEKLLSNIPHITKTSAIEKSLTDRLFRKTLRLNEIFESTKNDWAESFYILLARYFGMKINADAFEMLARSCPLNIVLRESDVLIKIEALLFGQAGFLNTSFNDEYPTRLKSEYAHLKTKYDLRHIPVSIWKYSKLRPVNFPSLKIALLANLIFSNSALFDKVLDYKNVDDIRKLLSTSTSEYWKNHYNFDAPSSFKTKTIGKSSIDILIINTIVPIIFLYGHINASPLHKDRAMSILSELPPESNSVITKWETLGFEVKSAYDSQGLLELKSNNCTEHKCLECPVGFEIMKNKQ